MRSHARATGLIILLALGAFAAWQTASQDLRNFFEDAGYFVNPTASRAFTYGERHFSSRDPAGYDIDRAEYFFNLAATKDSGIPYLYHELARVAFLKGDFGKALGFINAQITLYGDMAPNSYYVRGLIEGYMGSYDAAAKDYEHYLEFDPHNWAALNDYAWVLLKAGRAKDAAEATFTGLGIHPDNPWLLNSNATALYELGDYRGAFVQVGKASSALQSLTEGEWLRAYPGNDPKIAAAGITAFKKAVAENIHTIELALASSTVQSR